MNKKNVNLILIILWMLFIFVMSSFPAKESSMQSNIILNHINELSIVSPITFNFSIRKLAHIFEYFILDILIFNYFSTLKIKHVVFFSFLICILYAFTDEFHQLFVQGRSGKLIDVMIDSIGIFIGVFISSLIKKRI